ncbi:hypothetical protein G6F37_009190 [Rhizopus arrhizus]|nr:hypothetical protein G6F38_008868 [Rhizopus arrhizus]KAG1154725.1 hypothetical protein G6F37_009190 [Rhizopus arrhizus]
MNLTMKNLGEQCKKLRNNCDTVLNSEPVKIIIRNEGIKASHWRSLYTTGVIENVYKDKNDMVEQTRILSSSTTPPLPTQSSIASKRDSDELNDNTNNRGSNKKLSHLKLGDIKGLSLNDKLEKLTKAYGAGNILDLASPGLIPSRFAKEMKNIVRDLKIPLKLVCTREERAILIKTSEATSLKQIETVIKSIMLVPRKDGFKDMFMLTYLTLYLCLIHGRSYPEWIAFLAAQGISKWYDHSSPSPLRYLGFPLIQSFHQRRYLEQQLLQTVKSQCTIYSQRRLSIKGRVTIVNALILSKLCSYAATPTNQPPRSGNMPGSQVVARKRTSLMHRTTEANTGSDSTNKSVQSKVWRVGRSPGSVLLDMSSRSESPLQLMALIADQYPSRIAVATTKEGNRKIAEINFGTEDPSIDNIVKDGIYFEKDNLYLHPCKVLEPSVRLIRFRLSNLPFLSKDKLLPQLLASLQPYGMIMDLGHLREPVTGTYMGTGYAILSVPIGDDIFLPLSHNLPWSNAHDEGFHAVWNDMPTYCRYCHQEGHAVSECPKKRSTRVCWNCHKSGHIAADCSKDKPSKKTRKTPTAPTTREDVAEMPPTPSRPAEAKIPPAVFKTAIKRKKSVDSLTGDSPRIHNDTVLNTATTAVLLSTQDDLFDTIFSEPMDSQTTDQMEIASAAPGTPNTAGTTSVASQESPQAAQTNLSSGQASNRPQSNLVKTNDTHKQSSYIRYLRSLQYNLMAFQETHVTDAHIQTINMQFQLHSFRESDSLKSKNGPVQGISPAEFLRSFSCLGFIRSSVLSSIPTFRRNDEITSTIDYIFISNHLHTAIQYTDIHRLHSSWTDHQLLSLSINLDSTPTGFGLWRANPLLVKNKEYRSQLKQRLQHIAQHLPQSLSLQDQWDHLKLEIRKFTRSFAVNYSNWRSKSLRSLQRKRNAFLRSQPPLALRLQRLPVIDRQIESLQQELVDIAALKAGIRWREHGEKSAGYLKRIHHTRTTEQTIVHLQETVTGERVSSQAQLLEVSKTFYQDLYSVDPIHESDVDRYLSDIDSLPQLSHENQQSLISPIIIDDILYQSKKVLAKQSSPGADGLGYAFIHLIYCFKPLQKLVVKLYNAALSTGTFPSSWQGIRVRLLPKKGDLSSLRNWRPISLINCDAKIYTRVINQRMRLVMDDVTNRYQTRFLADRFIAENGVVLNILMEQAHVERRREIGLLLD